MSVDTLHAFYRAFRGDESFLQIFNEGDTNRFAASMVALGKENGFEFEEGDVLGVLENPDSFLKEALGDEELSDTELAVMAGGSTLPEIMTQTTIFTSNYTPADTSRRSQGTTGLLGKVDEELGGPGGSSTSGSGTSASTGGTSSKG